MSSFEVDRQVSSEAVMEQPIDYDYILDTFGLGPQEASATITFGSYTGTVAAMLLDGRCPVGGAVAEGYTTGGLPGVETKLGAMKTLYGDFDLNISTETRSYHEGSTQRSELMAKAATQKEPPDFLDQ